MVLCRERQKSQFIGDGFNPSGRSIGGGASSLRRMLIRVGSSSIQSAVSNQNPTLFAMKSAEETTRSFVGAPSAMVWVGSLEKRGSSGATPAGMGTSLLRKKELSRPVTVAPTTCGPASSPGAGTLKTEGWMCRRLLIRPLPSIVEIKGSTRVPGLGSVSSVAGYER